MLKYQFNINNNLTNLVEEIQCEAIFLSSQGDYISGLTSYNYNLVNNQTLYVNEDGTSLYQPYTAEISDVIRKGYVIYKQKYPIQEFIYNDQIYKGIVFADGYKYIADENNNLKFSSYFLNDNEFNANIGNETSIFINTRYYIYNGQINIGGYIYNVDFGDDTPSITLKDGVTKLQVQDYSQREYFTSFKISKNLDYPLTVEHISFTKSYPYIIYGTNYQTEKYYLQYDIVNDTKNFYLTNGEKKIPLTINNYNPDKSIDIISLENQDFQINEEWRNTENGDYVHLYLDNSNYEFHSGQKIKITSNPLIDMEYPIITDSNGSNFVIVQGEKYFVSNDEILYVLYEDQEYELKQLTYKTINENNQEIIDTKYYILCDNVPMILLKLSDTEVCRFNESDDFQQFIDNQIKYPIIRYKYVDINGEKIKVQKQIKPNSNTEYEVIYYNALTTIYLSVLEVKSGNQLRCKLYTNTVDNGYVLNGIVNFHENYIFELINQLFDDSLLDNKPYNITPYKNPLYKIYRSVSVLKIPIKLSTNTSLNLHQEFNCQTQFFDVEKNKAINPIIDMEKDIYYPYYYDFSTQKFTEIQKIKFYLHFRSRDLTNWKINNNSYINVNTDVYNNWNILDYYNADITNTTALNPFIDFSQCPYYQPSDLLYFLNFSDDDVFYQKDKIGKSFLRLSFYDNNDPRNQNLLHTATVFVNEGNLYQTYINNRKKNGTFINVGQFTSSSQMVINNNISVNTEPVKQVNDDFYEIDINDDKRLSMSFSIDNLFNSTESSEGFYLYLFKEYSNGLHEKDIHLKIEFNHASIGRTITFMQPYKIIDNNKEMLNFTNNDDLNILKRGCTLQSLYDHIYIKIHVKYDYDLKRFCYYLPEWLTKYNNNKSEMKFNLYELKLADESIDTTK